MSIKRIIAETFEEEFNSENMKKEILKKSEAKRQLAIISAFKIAIPICAIVVLFLIISVSSHNMLKDKVYINQLDSANYISRMCNAIEEETSKEEDVFINIKNKKLPDDFKKESYKKTYRKEDIRINDIKYVYTALGEENRYITIILSKEEDLSKNYAFNEEVKKSMINGLEVDIYQYHDTYLATFFYCNYYFELKTEYIEELEFIKLLKSIVKESK